MSRRASSFNQRARNARDAPDSNLGEDQAAAEAGGLILPEGAKVPLNTAPMACACYKEAFRRRRASASNPPAAAIMPGKPAPTIGPGTGAACTGPKRICRTSVRPTVLEIRTSVMNWAASVVSVKKFCPFPRFRVNTSFCPNWLKAVMVAVPVVPFGLLRLNTAES